MDEANNHVFDDGRPSFGQALEALINSYSVENESNTPDFLLAAYLLSCLKTWAEFTKAREQWFGTELKVKGVVEMDSARQSPK